MFYAPLMSFKHTNLDEEARLLSCRQSAAADRHAMASGTPGSVLMEKAGAGAAQVITQIFQDTEPPARTVILCGPGNNGGDGYVIARHLVAVGWPVVVGALMPTEDLIGDARGAADQWTGETLMLADVDDAKLFSELFKDCGLVVDALFGTGLERPLSGVASAAIDYANGLPAVRVAVDMPSGISGDTGQVVGGDDGGAFDAHLTVTFFRKKLGQVLMPGRVACGEVYVVPIGINASVLSDMTTRTYENTPTHFAALLGGPLPMEHKYDRGHALVCGGGAVTSGAARLAARAALRVGAGLVTTAFPADALGVYAAHQTAVMNMPYADIAEFRDILDSRKKNAFLIGPGHGVGETTRRFVQEVLLTGRPTLLDADALSSFVDNPSDLFDAISGPCVLTPHMGEFERLFPDLAVLDDRVKAAREAAKRVGCVVVLKGPDTIIANSDGRTVINSHTSPYLATAGTGDVLAGMIIGLAAQFGHKAHSVFEAAIAGVWLHGDAAQQLNGPFIAEDLVEAIPAAFSGISE